VLLVVADVVFGLPTRLAMELEDAVVQAAASAANQADRWGLVRHHPRRLQASALRWSAGFALLWAFLRYVPGRLGLALDLLLLVLPCLLATLPVVGLSFGLSPLSWTLFFAAALGSRHVRARRAPTGGVPPPHGLSRPGLFPRVLAALVLGFGVGNGVTLLASGPGDLPMPILFARVLQDLPGRPEDAIALLAALVLPRAGSAWVLASLLLVAGVAAGAPGVHFPALLFVCVAPLGSPRSSSGPLWAVGLACPSALLHVAVHGFLPCEAVRADPDLQLLSPLPGTFSTAVSGRRAIAVQRDQGAVLHLDLDSGLVRASNLLDLPAQTYANQRDDGGSPMAYPEEVGVDPDGHFQLFAEMPGQLPTSLVLRLRGDDGAVLSFAEWPGFCNVSSWAWDADRGRALVGCEWRPEVLDYDPRNLGDVVRRRLHGGGGVEELLPAGPGRWDTLSLWGGPWLRRVELPSGKLLDRQRVGTFTWEMVADDEDRIWVARFHARQLLALRGRDLEPIGARRVAYGVRGLAWDPRHRVVLAASAYAGTLDAVDPGGETRRKRIGGWVRDLDLTADGRTAVFGGLCGVFALDLDRWLGVPRGARSPRP
jgi:hypothetical protein